MGGVIVGSSYDIATRQDHWPFSDYLMFSGIHSRTVLEWPRLLGVTAVGSEIALVSHDLDRSRLPIGLRHLHATERDQQRVHAALEDCLERYERRRIAGEHDGQPPRGIHLAWEIEPYARNIDQPKSRQRIGEASVRLEASAR